MPEAINAESTRRVVYDTVASVAAQQHKILAALHDDMRLTESGLDSLCIAILIATLDDKLGISPFDADDADIPVTIGDLIRLYDNEAGHA